MENITLKCEVQNNMTGERNKGHLRSFLVD